ncbi:MAG: hypothetical protein VKJ02_06895 [Snowella sp.]|nr:hypothetical protein [Snowella sp.]
MFWIAVSLDVTGYPVKNSDRAINPVSQHLDKILFAIGFVYLVSISWWLTSQNRLVLPWGNRPQAIANSTSQAKLSSEDAQFIAYLQQSLKALNQSNASQPATAPSPSNPPSSPPVNNVLPVTIPTSQTPPPPPPATAPRVIERIYVPVYPPQTAQPIQQAAVPPVAVPVPPKPVLPQPPASQSPVALAQPSVAVAPPKPAIAPMVGNKNPHTLVGVLEFGDQSSALFTANGLTQRFQVGERIGSTDWVLTQVENQKAILSRQGKTRYLEVGQSF